MPDNLRQYGSKVLAHYFPTFPISIDNDPVGTGEYWRDNWEKAAVEGGATDHRDYGGYVRSRPFTRAPRSGTPPWQQQDCADDIAWAKDGGIYGFFVDVLNKDVIASTWSPWINHLLNAADADGDFKVSPQLDLTATNMANATDAQAADAIAHYALVAPVRGQTTGNTWRNCAWVRGGKLVVAAYHAEGWTTTKWTNVFADLLAQYGVDVEFWPTFTNFNANYVAYAALSQTKAMSKWGDGADDLVVDSLSDRVALSHAQGKEHYHECWFSDERESYYVGQAVSGPCDEPNHLEALIEYWLRVIEFGSDHVICNTWSDYREGSGFRPDVIKGYCPLDIAQYFQIRWLTGAYPAIQQDVVILSHRNQPYSGTAATTAVGAFRSGVQTVKGHLWGRSTGRTAFLNTVAAYVFLTAAATVRITIDGVGSDFAAPAGFSKYEVALGYGDVSASVIRSAVTVASVASPFHVRGDVGDYPYKDSAHYMMVSSARDPLTNGQYDWDASL